MIPSRLRSRCNGCGTFSARAAFGAKLDAHQERAFLPFRWIEHGLWLIPRTAAAAHSGVISTQANSLHPSVPEAGGADSPPCDEGAAGFDSAWMWAPREMTTVEIACLKMSCS